MASLPSSLQVVDAYLHDFTQRTFTTVSSPSRGFMEAARAAAHDVEFKDRVVASFRALPFVSPKAIQLVLRYDHAADTVALPERLALLQHWQQNADSIAQTAELGLSSTQLDYFCAMVDSELELARRGQDMRLPEVMYYRARSFAYTMLCVMTPELCPLMGTVGLEYTCDFAIASVILDDADDAEEDRAAQSATIFSSAQHKEAAVFYALNMIAALESKLATNFAASVLRLLGLLELQPTLVLAALKTLEVQGSVPRSPPLDITKAIASGQ